MKTLHQLVKLITTFLMACCAVVYWNFASLAAVNTAPTAIAQTVSVVKNAKNTPITLTGIDGDGNALTFVLLTQPGKGSLAGTVPNLTYTPNPDYQDVDSFTFKVNDGTIDSPPATVTINVVQSPGKNLSCWWEPNIFNTNDYNPVNSLAYIPDPKDSTKKIPNKDYIDPDGTSTPLPPSGESIAYQGRTVSRWILRKKADTTMAAVGGVGGGNRTVMWKPTGTALPYREVWGYFAEPDISRVMLDRRTNKPTYYYGLKGIIDTYWVDTDCGIQWEPAPRNSEGTSINDSTGTPIPAGWTLVNRITTGLNLTEGFWEIFGQYQEQGQTRAKRWPLGTLHTVKMGYVIDKSNLGVISMSNGSSLPIQYFNPQKIIQFTHLKRNVGLTQAVAPEEVGPDLNNPVDKNVYKASNALVYLDGSILKGLKFGGGELKTGARLQPSDPAQQSTLWSQAGNADELKPPDMADNIFIIDFVKIDDVPLTKPRVPPTLADKGYDTSFNAESVTVTMGSAKKTHKVKRFPRLRSR